LKNERKAQRSQRQDEHGDKTWIRQAEQQRKGEKKGAKEEEAGGAVQKEHGANKGIMLV